MNDMPRKYAVLRAISESNPDEESGYLRICKNGEQGEYGIYSIVRFANYATRFAKFNYDMKPGFYSPERVAEFMTCERELKGWVFKADYIDGFSKKPEEMPSYEYGPSCEDC